ncbi:MAG: hypothetical protein NW226_01810 [Microscillaceae bacterium]|nr:hypothetical protein [Microscillaceae bacterium]
MHKKIYIDLHCHPTIKPFGRSFEAQLAHSADPKLKNSIWFRDRPNFIEKLINWTTSLTKFTQSDYTTLQKGNCKIICVSLYPLERGFFDIAKLNLGTGNISDALTNLVLGVSKKRIDFVQKNKNYFLDLDKEYRFLLARNNQSVKIQDKTYRYKLVSNFQEIQEGFLEDTIYNILSIEGAHVFNCGYDPINDPAAQRKEEVLENVRLVKNWEFPPFFITLAHHFYNELCGHEETFTGIVKTAIGPNQKPGLGEGITPLGYEVIRALLDSGTGKRILIDLKHMSIRARREYYDLLKTEDFINQDIPLIVSHGAVAGQTDEKSGTSLGIPGADRKFLPEPINFFDFELIKIQQSGGVFGLQLDERRIATKAAIRKTRQLRLNKQKIAYHWSLLVWYQIQHIAEVLDRAGLLAWNITTLGSDFDGIIDPLSAFWNAETYPDLEQNLLIHAKEYLKKPNLRENFNKISAEEIIHQVMYGNAANFLEKYFQQTGV